MAAPNFSELIDRYLGQLEAVQSKFAELYREKDQALVSAKLTELEALSTREEYLCRALKHLAIEREKLLQLAQKCGHAVETLAALAEQVSDQNTGIVRNKRIIQCQGHAADLRRRTWSHWVVTQRSQAQYAALVDLIANRGKTAPTYDPARREGSEGSLIDASA
ncbi:flagellar export chaperone FlgN [Calycomorphotria hydatis]|uniref:FlgN protein n=1 Tax=Calycomorphotria hydatis TaxID=2528027 RepID=A0A517TCM9_9PLAN|nr:flagellar export chaperone FlgN [Calycomorphotria hydatis]QDT66130.1 FlgN protein [Calycomorphotria hydatis]